ncbi:hypothetical protein Leryth_017022 [Lithospermum erythrorhizon]|nr:hypothetical protein Leryth_017022 [Lithospermum erythrorhizon]
MRTTPSPFNRFLEAVKELKFDEKPDYMKLISFFDGLTIDTNTSELPGALKVNFEKDEQPKKKPRSGVTDLADSTMLRQLIDKGLEEGRGTRFFYIQVKRIVKAMEERIQITSVAATADPVGLDL